jgi:hypothetical protein
MLMKQFVELQQVVSEKYFKNCFHRNSISFVFVLLKMFFALVTLSMKHLSHGALEHTGLKIIMNEHRKKA